MKQRLIALTYRDFVKIVRKLKPKDEEIINDYYDGYSHGLDAQYDSTVSVLAEELHIPKLIQDAY